jgi:hypothetical protein
MSYLERVREIKQDWAKNQGVDTTERGAKSVLSAKSTPAVCSCPIPPSAPGCGPKYFPCVVCGYTWRCRNCGGCRQCGLPSRRVMTGDTDRPLTLGFAGLDKEEIARAERVNESLGVADPVARKLSVMNWLYRHYRDLGNDEIADRLKQAYWQLREPDPDLVGKVADADRETFLRRLCNGQEWLTQEYETRMADNPEVTIDENFQKALDTWVQWETHLRTHHSYQGCIHGEGQRCPADSLVSCNGCLSQTD